MNPDPRHVILLILASLPLVIGLCALVCSVFNKDIVRRQEHAAVARVFLTAGIVALLAVLGIVFPG